MGNQQFQGAQMQKAKEIYQASMLNCKFNATYGQWVNLQTGAQCSVMTADRTTYCPDKCSYENQVNTASGNATLAQSCASVKQQYCNMECNGQMNPGWKAPYTDA